MARLTRRSSGITDGYISNYKRDDLIQKLGAIEHGFDGMAEKICDHYCRHRQDAEEFGLEYICEACPLARLMELID